LISDLGAVDVEQASAGRFSSDPQAIYDRWAEFRQWASEARNLRASPFVESELGPPVPRPAQIFAIGANYAGHVTEFSDVEVQREWPIIFTKFPSSLTGPFGVIELPSGVVDWEVELVCVIGQLARRVPVGHAWDHVAGLTVGQDISEREIQFRGNRSNLTAAKSLPGFSPIGPVVVTPDAFEDPDDLAIGCDLDGESVQSARTSQLTHSVPELIAIISDVVAMLPGDLVFTGTPAGVGAARMPMRFLQPGQELVSRIDGIGEMRHTFHGDIDDEARRRDVELVAEGVRALAARIQASDPPRELGDVVTADRNEMEQE
jgi:2-keto-4-pentenoate hydratase/2-oxohepta-3-ene-1,7-dioic acid hydratase in catechol pathway